MAKIELVECRNLAMSAASGLLLIEDKFFCVADDDRWLFEFKEDSSSPTEKAMLFADELPSESRALKKVKPDLESLLYVAELNAIFAIPSGSEKNRTRGALVVHQKSRSLDFSLLFQKLWSLQPELNIEGAIVLGDEIKLFSRGNGASQMNLIISLSKEIFLNEAMTEQKLSEKSFLNSNLCPLGALEGQSLGFTDAALAVTKNGEKRIWFLAVAEGGLSTFEDGAFAGAILGCMDKSYKTLFRQELNISAKPEGLAINIAFNKFYVVTDADDRSIQSKLWSAPLPQVENILGSIKAN